MQLEFISVAKSFILCALLLFFPLFSEETSLIRYLKSYEILEEKSQLPLVDCIYVINLEERPEKWERTQKLFSAQGIKINRFSAINGWKLSHEIQKELAGPYPLRLRGGQLGCLLSHLSIVKDAYEKGYNVIWVLEDDIEFCGDISELPLLLWELSELDPHWDVFYTDVDSKDPSGNYVPSLSFDFRPDQPILPLSSYINRAAVSNNIMKIGQRFGMYSFFLSKSGMEKILNYFTHFYVWTAIDIDIHYIPGIREYAPIRDIVTIHSRDVSDTELQLLN